MNQLRVTAQKNIKQLVSILVGFTGFYLFWGSYIYIGLITLHYHHLEAHTIFWHHCCYTKVPCMKIQQDQNPEIHEAANELRWSRVIFENMRHQKSHTASGAVRDPM